MLYVSSQTLIPVEGVLKTPRWQRGGGSSAGSRAVAGCAAGAARFRLPTVGARQTKAEAGSLSARPPHADRSLVSALRELAKLFQQLCRRV